MAVTIEAKDVHNMTISGLTIAIFITLTRLCIRIKTGKLGWDDFWATASIAGACLLMAGVLIILDPKPFMSHLTLVAAYYITSEGFYMIVWTSRLSILFTIIRISPTSLKRILYGASAAFGVMWLFLAMQEIVICEREPSWKNRVPVQCELGKSVAIAQLITDIVADLCLLIAPVRLIWRAMLPAGQRARIIIVFSTCFLTTVVSLVHAYWIFANLGLNEIFTGVFETTISMIVASLNVIIGHLYRVVTKEGTSSSRNVSQGFELSHRSNPAPISVDITTTTYTDNSIRPQMAKVDSGSYEEVYDGSDNKTKYEV